MSSSNIGYADSLDDGSDLISDQLEHCRHRCHITLLEEQLVCGQEYVNCLNGISVTALIFLGDSQLECEVNHNICLSQPLINEGQCIIKCSDQAADQ